MAVKIQTDGAVMTAFLSGDIDHHSAASMRESIDSAVERCRPALLVLDFSGVGFMDSSGVGLIMGRFRLIKELGGNLDIKGASPAAAKMIKLAGLERLGIKAK